jgi:hypothetical protein
MVGFLGFAVLALGGGALALFLGVPPVFIGAYVVGLVLLGAISGFSSGDGGGGSGGSRGSRSSGGGGSALNKAADAANGFMDALGSSSDDRSSGRDRRNRDSSTSSRSSGTSIVSLSASDISSGGSASDVDIRVSVRDGSGSGLSELKLEVPGMGSGTSSISGSSHSNVYNLAGDILGSDPSPADDTYQVNAIVEDSEGYTDSKSTRFTVGGVSSDSSSSSSSSSSGSGSGGGNEFDFSEMFKDMTIGQSQQQQMQQQMMSWMQMYQSQMQQQQMQQMMNPGVMQFGNLLQGNFNVVNNTVIVPGENSEVEININQMQQLIQVLSQSQQNENYLLSIMAMLVQEGDGGLNQQIINQITNLVYEENKGDVSIEQEINRFINQKRVEYINNVLIQEVEQNFTLNQVQESLALQISEFFIALENTQYNIEGNEVIIAIKDAKDLRIHYSTLLQFLKVVNKVPEGLVETIVVQILNQIVVKGGQDSIDEEIVREIIMIIEKAEEGDIESSPTDIQVENIVIIDENTGKKLPEKVLDSGGLVYRASPGISSGRLKVNPRVSTSGGDLQEVIFSLSSGKGSTQKRIGVNTSSYGYNGEGVTLEDIKGQFQLNQGQQFNLGVTFIAKDGNQRNKVCRIQVKGGKGSGKGPLPDKKRNSSVPANQQSHGNSGVPANARSQGKSDLPANPQNPGGTSGSGGSGEEALVPKDENEIQKDLQEAGEDISEAEDLTQKALEDARAGRLPEAEDEAEQAEKDLEEANEDIEESEEDIYSVETQEENHFGETADLISEALETESNLMQNLETLSDNYTSGSGIRKEIFQGYRDIIREENNKRVKELKSGELATKAENFLNKIQDLENTINDNFGRVNVLPERLNIEENTLEHLESFIESIDADIKEEENTEQALRELAEYSSNHQLEENTEKLVKQKVKLESQESKEIDMFREISSHLRESQDSLKDLMEVCERSLEFLDKINTETLGEVENSKNMAMKKLDGSNEKKAERAFELLIKIEDEASSAEIKQEQKVSTLKSLVQNLESY